MAVLPPDPVYTLRCPEMGPVHSLCFHQNERLLAGTQKGNVYLWDLQTNRSSLHFNIGTQPITTLHHTDDLLISQEKGGNITIWSMCNTGYMKKHTLNSNYMGFCRSAIQEDKTNVTDCLLFYPTEDKTILIIPVNKVNDCAPIELLPEMEYNGERLPQLGMLTCLKPFKCSDKCFVLAGYESGHFLTWDVGTKSIVDMQTLDPDSICVDYNPNTNRGVIGGPSDKITAFSYQRPTMQLQRSTSLSIKNPGLNCIRIRNDLKVFCSGGWDGRIRVFSWKSLRPLAVLTEHKTGAIMDIAYSTDKVGLWNAPIMAVAGVDGQISLWDLYN